MPVKEHRFESRSRTRPHIGVAYGGGTISSLQTKFGHREGGHPKDLIAILQEKDPNFVQDRFTLGQPRIVFTGLSENLTNEERGQIGDDIEDMVDSREYDSIVLTHGTDSMEKTIRALRNRKSLMDKIKAKGMSIIVTGAADDADKPGTDVWDNLKDALDIATRTNLEPDVYLSFHKRLIPGALVVKKPYTGELGFDFLNKSSKEFSEAQLQLHKRALELLAKLTAYIDGNPYEHTQYRDHYERIRSRKTNILEFRADVDEEDPLNLLALKDRKGLEKAKAALLVLYHSGTANTNGTDNAIDNLVKNIRDQHDVVFFAVTENGEPVDLHAYETSVKLREAGVVPLYDMPRQVAYEKLAWAVGKSEDPSEMIDLMLTNLVGEIDEERIHPEDIHKLKDLYNRHPAA